MPEVEAVRPFTQLIAGDLNLHAPRFPREAAGFPEDGSPPRRVRGTPDLLKIP